MATWSVLTGRKLVPGAYDEWRAAWQPEEMPEGVKAYILRKVGDPDEVVAFGFFDGTRDELEALRPDPSVEEARQRGWHRMSRASSPTASTRWSRSSRVSSARRARRSGASSARRLSGRP